MIETVERVDSTDGEACAKLQRETWETQGGNAMELWRVVRIDAHGTYPGADLYHATEYDDEAKARRRYDEAAAYVKRYEAAAR